LFFHQSLSRYGTYLLLHLPFLRLLFLHLLFLHLLFLRLLFLRLSFLSCRFIPFRYQTKSLLPEAEKQNPPWRALPGPARIAQQRHMRAPREHCTS
jgi:hypothetical protein